MRYSFDDQYNIVTSKCYNAHNIQVHEFSAIDYFQFAFTEHQLHDCWKLVTQISNNATENCYIPKSSNIARLENLVWRKWAKTKFKLEETEPETVNWHKESDITWLYGPLVKSSYEIKQQKQQQQQHQPHRLFSSAPNTPSSSSPQPQSESESESQSQSKSFIITPKDTQHSNVGSFSSVSTASTLDVGSFDNTFLNCYDPHLSDNNFDNNDLDDDDDKTVVFIDDFKDCKLTYDLIGDEQNLKPILKYKISKGPLDFDRCYKDNLSCDDNLNKSVSFADMVQIRRFY